MAKTIPFNNFAKKVQPKKGTSKKSDNIIIDQWMSDGKKQKGQDSIVYSQVLEEDKLQPQENITNTKNPRIETQLLKNRIAEKLKNFDKTS